MGKSVLHQSAPSPAFGGYFPINGEECSASIAPSPAFGGYFPINGEECSASIAPSPGFAGYFPINGDEFSSIRRALHLGRRAISGGGLGGVPAVTAEPPRSRPSARRPASP